MVVASFFNEHQDTFYDPLKRSLLSSVWEKKKKVTPTEGLNFLLTETSDLKIAKRFSNNLLYTLEGVLPKKSIDDPIFIVGSSISRVTIDNQESFSRSRILGTASVVEIKIEKVKEVMIDAIKGYEIIARGQDEKLRRLMLIYQVILFETKTTSSCKD